MKKSIELRELKAAKIEEATRFEELAETRELTTEENEKFNELIKEARSFEAEIKTAEDFENLKKEQVKVIKKQGGEEKEKRELKEAYSITKAIQTLASKKELTGVEAEMHQEAAKENRNAGVEGSGNLGIPQFMMEKRTDVDQATSAIQPTEVGKYYDALRENAIYEQVGADVMHGLSADHKIVRVTEQSLAWASAENSAAADGGSNFGKDTLSPTRLTGLVNVSNRMILQNGQQVVNKLMMDLGRESANKISDAIFSTATVTNAPTSLGATSGLGTFTEESTYVANASILEDLIAAEMAAADAEGLNAFGRYVLATNLLKDLKLSAQVASVIPAMEGGVGSQIVNGYPVNFTTSCTKSAGTSGDGYFGDFRQLTVGFFGAGINLTIDPWTQGANDQTRIIVHNNVDWAVGQAAGIIKFTSLVA